MRVQALEIPEVKLVTPQRNYDERGFFSETYNRRDFAALGIDAEFVQDNHSFSAAKGVVRGLHFQVSPHAQGKLVRVGRGAIFDVALDIRQQSPTRGQHISVVLTEKNWAQIWIPIGFAHGFCTLEPNTEVLYKTTDYHSQECSRGIAWDDPALRPVDAESAILSETDRHYPFFADLAAAFELM
jgi:dTDP-4-dehydrorhamnose 3,5-epimerase